MEDDDDPFIKRLNLSVEGNCIQNDDPPIPFYPVIYGMSPSDLLTSYEHFTSNHPDMGQVFLDIANTNVGGVSNPVAHVVVYTYYLNYLEECGVDILSPLNQLRKYSRDLVAQSGFESVLLVAHFLASHDQPFIFPDSEDASIGSPLILIDEGAGKGLTVEVKCHWVEPDLQSRIEYFQLLRGLSPSTQNDGQDPEMPEMNLVEQLKGGLIHGDIIMLDEGLHVVEVMRDLYPRAQLCKNFPLQEGNIVFFGLLEGAGLLFFETCFSEFLQKLQEKGI